MELLKMVKTAIVRDDVAGLTAEIERMKDSGVAAYAEIDRREAAKIEAEDFAEVERHDREILKQRWLIAKLDKKLPGLEAKLATAKFEEKRQAHDRHQAAVRDIYARLRKAIGAACQIQAEAMRAREAASAELGEEVVTRNIPIIAYAGFLFPEYFVLWIKELDRALASPAPKLSPPPAAKPPIATGRRGPAIPTPGVSRPIVKALPPRVVPDGHGKFSKVPSAPGRAASVSALQARAHGHVGPTPAPAPKRNADDLAPLAADEVRIKVIRAGFCPADDAPQCDAGQIVRMKRATARASRGGAFEIIEEGPTNV